MYLYFYLSTVGIFIIPNTCMLIGNTSNNNNIKYIYVDNSINVFKIYLYSYLLL